MVFQTDVLINTSQITAENQLSIIPDRFGTNEIIVIHIVKYLSLILTPVNGRDQERSAVNRSVVLQANRTGGGENR